MLKSEKNIPKMVKIQKNKQTHKEDGKVNSTNSCTTTVQQTLQTMAEERLNVLNSELQHSIQQTSYRLQTAMKA